MPGPATARADLAAGDRSIDRSIDRQGDRDEVSCARCSAAARRREDGIGPRRELRPGERRRPRGPILIRHGRSTNSSIDRSIDRSTIERMRASARVRPGRALARPIGAEYDRSVDRSINRVVDRPINRSINRAVDRPISRSMVCLTAFSPRRSTTNWSSDFSGMARGRRTNSFVALLERLSVYVRVGSRERACRQPLVRSIDRSRVDDVAYMSIDRPSAETALWRESCAPAPRSISPSRCCRACSAADPGARLDYRSIDRSIDRRDSVTLATDRSIEQSIGPKTKD
jgi:hypothetical protein